VSNLLFCKICGASLRSSGSVRCAHGCCPACHRRYCSAAGLDIEQARTAERIRLLAAQREDLRRETRS
jgi:hypothetical protein